MNTSCNFSVDFFIPIFLFLLQEDPINAVKESRNEESVNNESKTAKSGDLFGESDSLFTGKHASL